MKQEEWYIKTIHHEEVKSFRTWEEANEVAKIIAKYRGLAPQDLFLMQLPVMKNKKPRVI